MEEVAPEHDLEQSSEEYVANAVVCRGRLVDLDRINESMVGTMEPALDILASQGLVTRKGDRIILSDLSRVMAEHFIGVERLNEILRLMETTADPVEIVAELECAVEGERGKEPEKEQEKGKKGKR